MSIRIYRPLAASALLIGALCLPTPVSATPATPATPAALAAAPAVRPARPAAAGPAVSASVLDAAWTRLLHLFADDHGGTNDSSSHHGHSGGGPDNDEGPGMCPHGH